MLPLYRLQVCDLQYAMLLIPACHLLAGVGLAGTEQVLKAEKAKAKASRLGSETSASLG